MTPGTWCQHGRIGSTCKECGGSGICQHGREKASCKECGGRRICQHGRQRSGCKECGGSMCQHGRQKTTCKECGGSRICQHGRQKASCKDCASVFITACKTVRTKLGKELVCHGTMTHFRTTRLHFNKYAVTFSDGTTEYMTRKQVESRSYLNHAYGGL